jgi:hypothetical protein
VITYANTKEKGNLLPMKMLPRRFVFLLPLLATLLMALAPGVALAASRQVRQATGAHALAVTAHNDCGTVSSPKFRGTVVIVTDQGQDVDCFDGNGTLSVGLYTVTAVETDDYDLSFTWKDYQGAIHNSFKTHHTFLSAYTASPGYFAGHGDMYEITSITLTFHNTPLPNQQSCTPPSGALWVATHSATDPANRGWFAPCFTEGGSHQVKLYGVYAIESGGWNVIYQWQDYAGHTGTGSLGYWSMLAPGSAGSDDGFDGAPSIALITDLVLYSG